MGQSRHSLHQLAEGKMKRLKHHSSLESLSSGPKELLQGSSFWRLVPQPEIGDQAFTFGHLEALSIQMQQYCTGYKNWTAGVLVHSWIATVVFMNSDVINEIQKYICVLCKFISGCIQL